jgi:hypothetical protein
MKLFDIYGRVVPMEQRAFVTLFFYKAVASMGQIAMFKNALVNSCPDGVYIDV